MDRAQYTLNEKLLELVNQFPDRVAMQIKKNDGYFKYTYREIYKNSQSIANYFLEQNIKKGDRIAILLENRPEWGMIYFGIMLVGGIAVPIDPQSSLEDIVYFLNDSEAKMIFTSKNLLPSINGLENSVVSLQKIIALDLQKAPKEIVAFQEIISPVSDLKCVNVSPEDVASILYTSGTTGKPKGVMLTHNNFYSSFRSAYKFNIISDKDNFISILPLHHSFPFMVNLIIPLFLRSRITYVSTLKSEELLECMRETGVSILVGVPQLFYMFYKNILDRINKASIFVRLPLSGLMEILFIARESTGTNLPKIVLSKIHNQFGKKLRMFISGGAKLDKKAAKFLTKTGFTILEGYGLTETSAGVTFNELKKQIIGSVGKSLPGVEIKIADPDKKGIGEVVIKGPCVMKGYYKQKDETEKVLRGNWFYTGDLGYFDKNENLYITGRKKELIVLSSGKNISLEEVEAHYSKSPFIKELCILTAGEKEQEKLVAVVVPDLQHYRKAGEINIYERLKWDLETLSRRYPPYKRIMGFVVANKDLPRTRLGKLKRFEIKNQYSDELEGKRPRGNDKETPLTEEDKKIISSEIGKKIIEILNKETNIKRAIRLDDHLEIDIGLDSLGRVELMGQLEKNLKIKIPDNIMSEIFTVRELIIEIGKLAKKQGKRGKDLSRLDDLSFWKDTLKKNPDKKITERIAISPGWIGRGTTTVYSNFLYILFKMFWRLKIYGTENLPINKPFILCPNHTSYLDGFLLLASLPKQIKNNIFFLGLSVYFNVPIIKYILKLTRIIPVDPGEHLLGAMQACAYVLKHDKVICVFPEGRRSIDGEIKEFKKGVGILAEELNIPLVPVYIKGSFESWPRTKWFPRPKPIKVVFGKPKNARYLRKTGAKSGAENNYDAITTALRKELINLRDKSPTIKATK